MGDRRRVPPTSGTAQRLKTSILVSSIEYTSTLGRSDCMTVPKDKKLSKNTSGVALGVALGTAFGVAFGQLAVGIAIGLALGAAYDGATKKRAP